MEGVLGRSTGPAALVVLALALLAGCGGDEPARTGSPPATTTATAAAPATTTTTAPPEGIDPMDGAGTAPVKAAAENTETALLTDVRAARHEGYDRVVFEFANALPGHDVRYVEPPVREDGSGRVVELDAPHMVQIRMENALDADLEKPGAPLTYTGPRRLTPDTPEVSALVRTGGFEGVLTWVVGLRDRVDFRVSTLDEPPRIVVDFRNH